MTDEQRTKLKWTYLLEKIRFGLQVIATLVDLYRLVHLIPGQNQRQLHETGRAHCLFISARIRPVHIRGSGAVNLFALATLMETRMENKDIQHDTRSIR